MSHFAALHFVMFERDTGSIFMTGTSFSPLGMETEHAGVLVVDHPVDGACHFVADGRVQAFPPMPPGCVVFDFSSRSWVADIEKATSDVMAKRAALLAASDWTQLPDVPLNAKTAWAAYRQSLRDITAQPGYPLDVTWPEPPSN